MRYDYAYAFPIDSRSPIGYIRPRPASPWFPCQRCGRNWLRIERIEFNGSRYVNSFRCAIKCVTCQFPMVGHVYASRPESVRVVAR